MVDAGVARGPGVPWAGTFLETNVRLYSVDRTGRRGIVFLSLDSDRALVVAGARAVFGLPYRWARMRYDVRPDGPSAQVHTYRRDPAASGADPAVEPHRGPGRGAARGHPARRLPQRSLGPARAVVRAAPSTCPTPTGPGRCATPSCWSWTTG